MANSSGWGDGAANNTVGWGQGANNAIGWGDSHSKSWAGATNIAGLTTDADAQAFIAAAVITKPSEQVAIDNLVLGMKADGIWTKMKAIYPFVGGTASTHKFNLKDPVDSDAAFRLVFNGGWTHSVNGATPNGTNGYADTKFIPSSNYSANNSSFGVYSRINNVNSGTFIGTSNASTTSRILMFVGITVGGASQINHNSSIPTNPILTNSSGLYTNSRNTSNQQKLFYNGSLNTTTVNLEQNLSTLPIYLSAYNNNSTISDYSNRQIAFAHLSDGLTDAEAANLYTRVQAFQTALSRQV